MTVYKNKNNGAVCNVARRESRQPPFLWSTSRFNPALRNFDLDLDQFYEFKTRAGSEEHAARIEFVLFSPMFRAD